MRMEEAIRFYGGKAANLVCTLGYERSWENALVYGQQFDIEVVTDRFWRARCDWSDGPKQRVLALKPPKNKAQGIVTSYP